jgi:disulfide bond formation protein DsbB
MEQQPQVNVIAVLVATAANFVLGFLWYTPLFGKAWAKEMKFDTSVKPPSSLIIKGMIIMVIGNFLMAYVFAHNNMAWTFVPGMEAYSKPAIISNAAIFTWLGFYLPGDLSRVAWEGASWKLFGINTAYHLVMLFVAALVLTYMS